MAKMNREKINKKNNKMEVIIVTGLSGAGKTDALKYFEDIGYYSIDNLPADFLVDLIEYIAKQNKNIKKIALSIDLRCGYFFEDIYKGLEKLKEKKIKCRILYLEASKSVIVKRYSLTRRKHPLVEDGNLMQGIEEEIRKMKKLNNSADVILDTTLLNPKELRIAITELLMGKTEVSKLLQISIVSFGYKYGIPGNLDMVMDVRFLPNPYYNEDLKDLGGRDKKVIDHVLKLPEAIKFLKMFENMLDFLIPNYIDEGKRHLGVGIGCTGGRHRSVVLSDKIYEHLKLKGYSVKLVHKDITKKAGDQ